jgi:hypothetical protein
VLTLLLLHRRKVPWPKSKHAWTVALIEMTVVNGCAGRHNYMPMAKTYNPTIAGTSDTETGSTTVILQWN